ncbi:MAG: hypothetical protein QF615_05305, partial [Planctomycetota bacterium]|nr:hypothetical protein [Planctomycetota bacterium]
MRSFLLDPNLQFHLVGLPLRSRNTSATLPSIVTRPSMTIHRIPPLLGSVALFSALALATYSGMPSQDQFLKDSELKKLAQSLADYIEARVDEKGVSDATGDVAT